MSTSYARVFKGCTALMAAATSKGSVTKSSAAVAVGSVPNTAAKAEPKAKGPKKKTTTATNTTNSGILKVKPVSPALAKFMGAPEVSRTDATKKIWEYIKLNNLQSAQDKRIIECDEKLKTIFQGKDKVGFLEIARFLSPHFIINNNNNKTE